VLRTLGRHDSIGEEAQHGIRLSASPLLSRRRFMLGTAAALAGGCLPAPAEANVPVPYDWNATPPMDDKLSFIEWMVRNRGEEAGFLGQRWDRFRQAVANRDLWEQRDMRAFLLTPREEFVTKLNLGRAYESHALGIGYGVTISDPHIVARMTGALNVARGDKALEIGTGSGYQSAYLANLTDKVWSIEIIKPLAERTRRLYDSLIERGYAEYKSITTRHADGYYGWEQEAPFDRVIVTCAIDHIPPPLLQQMKPNGIMVIPVGPPGAQHALKVTKQQAADGSISVTRSDIYHGGRVSFVPFTKLEGDLIKAPTAASDWGS
jgi:protein-L-isoaspartate(D-aspartate) O-methyltransferase